MSEWRPIETAPKDGTLLLFYLAEAPDGRRSYELPEAAKNWTIGFWMHQTWKSIETIDAGGMGGEMTGWMADYVCLDAEPTHWMPLPEPPSP
jgi:hypothetical protein